jgi:hypothetical protein
VSFRAIRCVLEHLSADIGDRQQHALIRLANYAHDDGSGIIVGHRRLMQESGIPNHALRKALTKLEDAGWVTVEGRGPHGVYRRRINLCWQCQRVNSRHAKHLASVSTSYALPAGQENGQRVNSRHETYREGSRQTDRPGGLTPAPGPPAAVLTDGDDVQHRILVFKANGQQPRNNGDGEDQATGSQASPAASQGEREPSWATGDPFSNPAATPDVETGGLFDAALCYAADDPRRFTR